VSTPPFQTIELSDPRFEQVGLRSVTVKSTVLKGRADLTVFIPRECADQSTAVPLVILLHGVYGSHWCWSGKAGAHLTTQRLIAEGVIPPMVLAMPSDGMWGDGSAYLPHRSQNFEQWIVTEVPIAARLTAPMLTTASPLFLAGLSMGGFGALRLGAKYADRFRAISGHSSITHFEQMKDFVSDPVSNYMVPPEDHSVLEAMLRRKQDLPAIRFDCGRDDPLIGPNRALHQELERQGIAHHYAEFPGGHAWPYWEEHLADTLRFFAASLSKPN